MTEYSQGEGQDKKVHNPEILEPDNAWQAGSQQKNYHNPQSSTLFYSVSNNDGCLAAAITFILFIVCVSSFGLLGGVGFIFFHICIAIAGSIVATRRMINGKIFNFWQWRVCNWIISFLLVFWLSGA